MPAEKHTPTAKRRDEKASLYVLDPEDEIVDGRWYDEGGGSGSPKSEPCDQPR